MLNKNGERELAYVVKVDDIKPIAGKDRVECAIVGGWTCMVPKNSFKPGDLGVYFEIDSKLNTDKEIFAFTAKYKGKIKTQKFKTDEGPFYSQGLLMAFKDFGWEENKYELGTFLTKELEVTYADEIDNKRKSSGDPNAKYKRMCTKHPKLFRNPIIRKIYKTKLGKKILYAILGKCKSDKKLEWPDWVVKTDEERIQNLSHRIEDFSKMTFIGTEKIDGTSTTFTMKRGKKENDYRVCSRNVVMSIPKNADKNFYKDSEGNVYLEMAEKYNMKDVLSKILEENDDLDFVTIQGETYGGAIQKRNYSIDHHDLAIFNVIFGNKDGSKKRLNPIEMKDFLDKYELPSVPVLGEIKVPNKCKEILELAEGESMLDKLPREGIVFRSLDGVTSFKAVSNSFLVKYHG